ncbi:MAG: hypothetical protein ACJ0CN_03640 [Candidatus Poseidoniaceae archaeon]
MGLLDKAGGASESKPKAKAVAKAKPVAKAVAKAKPVAKAVAKVAEPVAVAEPKAKKEKKAKKPRKPRQARPSGLPEGFQIANKLDRTMSWFVNFAWNFGVFFAALFMMASDTGLITTILLVVSVVMMLLNVIILPFKTGRNLGQFVSRIKYVNYEGEKSNPIQGALSNSVGILALFGFLFIFVSTSDIGDKDAGPGPIIFTVVGAIFVILYIVNWQFAKASEYNQGLYDVMFGAYLVKHVPTAEEKSSGFWAKFESMGDYGDKFAARREAKMLAQENEASGDSAAGADEDSKAEKVDDKPKAKAKAKAKAKPKAKAAKK